MEPVPARMHVLLARRSARAVVIRRGPARSVCSLLWDRRDDSFEVGQWMRGRIYERRCDLSPDGRHLIYFALTGAWDGPAKGAYTVVSRAPYLKALSLWPKGDAWNGGGLFLDNTAFWLNGCHERPLQENGPFKLRAVDEVEGAGRWGGECPGVYYLRLQRDGWTMTEEPKRPSAHTRAVFERPLLHGWRLRKLSYQSLSGKHGFYYDHHQLVDPGGNEGAVREDWEWADLDPDRERLLWTSRGCVHAARLEARGLRDERVLAELDGLRFERLRAPY